MKCVNQRYYINNTMYNWKKEKEEKEKKRRKKILGRRKSEYCYGGTAIDKKGSHTYYVKCIQFHSSYAHH